MVYYFAYGSNMDKDRMKERVQQYKIIGKGILESYRVIFNKPSGKSGEGYANIMVEQNKNVEGIIYEIDENGIKKLNNIEGVPNHYKKEIIIVNYKGKKVECQIYIAAKTENGLKPTKKYLGYLLKGKEFLSEKYYNNLKNIETID